MHTYKKSTYIYVQLLKKYIVWNRKPLLNTCLYTSIFSELMTSKYLPLLIVDTCKVAMNNSMVGAEIQRSQVCSNRPGAQRTTCKGKRKQALHNADCLVSITTFILLHRQIHFYLKKHHQRKKENNNKQNLNTLRTFNLPIYSNFWPAFSLYLHLCNRLWVKRMYAFPSNFKRQMTMAVLSSISTILFSFCVPNWVRC